MHLEHLVITRKTVTGLADRLPLSPPEHPDYPPGHRRLQRVDRPPAGQGRLSTLGHELLPKNVEGTRDAVPTMTFCP